MPRIFKVWEISTKSQEREQTSSQLPLLFRTATRVLPESPGVSLQHVSFLPPEALVEAGGEYTPR